MKYIVTVKQHLSVVDVENEEEARQNAFEQLVEGRPDDFEYEVLTEAEALAEYKKGKLEYPEHESIYCPRCKGVGLRALGNDPGCERFACANCGLEFRVFRTAAWGES